MKKQKHLMMISALIIISIIFVGCSNDDDENSTADDQETFEVQISYENNTDEPIHSAAEKWKELAEEKSNGRLEIELFPSSQLGSKTDVIEQGMTGSNVIQIADASFLMDFVPDLGILSAPYLTDSYDELFYLTETDWFEDLHSQLNDEGLHIIDTSWIYGTRHLMTKDQVKTPDDLKNQKIRVPDNKLFLETFKSMGAIPTPMPLGDLYPAMQQGTVDGAENPLPVLSGSKLDETVDYLALTGHTKMILQWVAGEEWVNTLPEDLLTILEETAKEASVVNNEGAEEKDEEVLETFESEGIEISEVDTELFREATLDVYDEFPEWSDGLHEKVKNLLEEK